MIDRKKLAGGACYVVAFVVAFSLGLLASFFGERDGSRAPRGTVYGAIPLEFLTLAEMRERLEPVLVRVDRRHLILKLESSQLEASVGQLGVKLDVDAVTTAAMNAGRKKGVLQEFVFWLSRLSSPHEVSPVMKTDLEVLRAKVKPWSDRLLPQPRVPEITYKKQLLTEYGQAGSVIQWEMLSRAVETAALRAISEPIVIEITIENPLISKDSVDERKRQAEALLSSSVLLYSEHSEKEILLSPRHLGEALFSEISEDEPPRLLLKLDAKKLRARASELLSEVERPPESANFEFGPGGAKRIVPSKVGLALDEARLSQELLALPTATQRRLRVPFVERAPKFSTEDAEKLEIGGVVSMFSTHHACCQPRVENIHVAAAILDGTVLQPGEKFSLNQLLGPRTQAAGYFEAPTIVRGEMEETWGGGISQLATTLFNAALRGGLEIVQRQPHSIYFTRYPEGHEATVSFPEPDLIFRNDTEAPLLIKTQYSGTFIKVLLYGDNGGRTISLKRSKRFDIVQPPTEYELDPEMDHERPRRLEAGQMGWTVTVSRTIAFKDGSKSVQTRKVVYQPRAQLLKVHPCTLPEEAEEYTGEPCPEPEEPEESELDNIVQDPDPGEETEE